MKKKILLGSGLTAILLIGLGSHLVLNKAKAGDIPPIVQQVQHQQEELDNHDARISNSENDIKDLQNNTGTPPSPNNGSVPTITTQAVTNAQLTAPSPSPSPAPITVKTSTITLGGAYDGFCRLVYTDDSTNYIKANTTYTQDGTNVAFSYDCAKYLGQVK